MYGFLFLGCVPFLEVFFGHDCSGLGDCRVRFEKIELVAGLHGTGTGTLESGTAVTAKPLVDRIYFSDKKT